MNKDKFILVASDNSHALAAIIKNISGFEQYTCITATKVSNIIELVKSFKPDLIILHFREVKTVLKSLQFFFKLENLNLYCLKHKFCNTKLNYTSKSLLFIQSYEDALKNNSLKTNINYLLVLIQNANNLTKKEVDSKKSISASYKNRNSSLARYVLELDQKKTLLHNLEQRIKQLCIDVDISTRSKLVSLLSDIKISKSNKNHWEDFKIYFENINPSFIKKLSFQFPKLTSKDLKYCCYLKMNMSNEDICKLLGINQESVRTHKYRLKRKLTLSKEENLQNFLQAFLQ